MATNSARQAVLQTTELLEYILLHLDFFDVWRYQRVCKHFQAVIQKSSRLQETMMLSLGNRPRQTWEHFWEPTSEDIRWKPRFRLATKDDVRPSHHTPKPLMPAKLCPLLGISQVGRSELPASALRLQYRIGEAVVFRINPPVLSADANWKELFVTDPPCRKASVSLQFCVGGSNFFENGSIRVVRSVEAADGLKLKHLVDSPLQIPGEVVWTLKGQGGYKHYQCPGRLLKNFENRLKAKAAISRLRTIVNLEGIVIPTEEEWRSIS